MSDDLYFEALARVERRLSNPRDLAIHTILVSVVSTIALVSNLVTYRYIHGGTESGIYLWALALATHGLYHYRRSGLYKNAREDAIQEELLRLANEYDLSIEELIDLHARLAEDVKHRAMPLRWTLATIVGYQALWQGYFWSGMMMNVFMTGYYVTIASNAGLLIATQFAPFVGTAILGFVQLVALFFGRRTAEDSEVRNAYLRALYNTKLEKSKRQATQRLAIDDEGEIVLEDAGLRKQR